MFRILLAALFLPLAAVPGSRATAAAPSGERVKVVYWEKWTGFEKDAMEKIVKEFNESQYKIEVEYLSVSSVNQKTLIATAGGRPPDVAGLWDGDVVVFADKNALIPLDDFLPGSGIGPETYIPVYWDMCTYQGHVWALPSTPATTALHWNKEIFRKAGMDPERPPKTFAELDEFSRKLTRVDPDTKQIVEMGFLPPEPGWWHYGWGTFFGGNLWDGDRQIMIDSEPWVKAFGWIQGYAKEYGVSSLQTFRSSFGNFNSPQNPFMSGQVAMVLQGVWMANYIFQNAPKMKWGAAPFPVVNPGDQPVTFAGTDTLMIPRGAKHPKEAFEFIRYVNQQGPMERLCLSHRKNSPLRRVSEEFLSKHENPYIRMFQQLAWSPNAVHQPKMNVWNEYNNEISNAFEKVWLMQVTPQEAVVEVKARIQKAWDRNLATEQTAPSGLLKVAPFAVAGLIILAVLAVALVRELSIRREVGGPSRSKLLRGLGKGLGFSSPWLFGLALFTLYPLAASVIYSFCDYSVLTEPKWIAGGNFAEIAGDTVFWMSLKNTIIYAVFALPLGLLMALVVALLLDTNVKGVGIYRTLFFLPAVTPLVASAIIWLWIFNSQFGVLNYAIEKLTFGYVQAIPWLSDARYAMPALILMSFWGIGHTMVILLAAMQDVPTSLYEAADMDGATWWLKIRHVTLPLISPVIYFNAIMGVIGVLQVFAVPYIMTGGGPARATLFYSMYLYNNAFLYLRMGYACAMAWILFIIILALTGIAVRISKTHVYYVSS